MDKPFTSKHCTPLNMGTPLQQENTLKESAKTAAKQGLGQVIKRGLGKAAAGVFGTVGALLTPTTLYAGPEKKEKSMSWEEVDAFQKQRDAQKYIPK